MNKVIVYGADWCGMTQNTMKHLRDEGVDFQYIDIDKDRKSAKWVAEQNGGKEKKPTLDIGGQVLSVPTDQELDEVLVAKGIL